MGEQNESIVFEKFAEFRVNGVKGWGAAEWECLNTDGFPKKN